jgi:hypothetical protein
MVPPPPVNTAVKDKAENESWKPVTKTIYASERSSFHFGNGALKILLALHNAKEEIVFRYLIGRPFASVR